MLAVRSGELGTTAAAALVFVEAAKVSAALCCGRGAGGGRLIEAPWPSTRSFFKAVISWRRARFSDSCEPSTVRKWSSNRSRSAISPSSVVMYSVEEENQTMFT